MAPGRIARAGRSLRAAPACRDRASASGDSVHWPPMMIRRAETSDTEAIVAIVLPTIREGATYALDADMSEADALAYWMGPAPGKETFVAEEDGVVVGTYVMRPNQAG